MVLGGDAYEPNLYVVLFGARSSVRADVVARRLWRLARFWPAADIGKHLEAVRCVAHCERLRTC